MFVVSRTVRIGHRNNPSWIRTSAGRRSIASLKQQFKRFLSVEKKLKSETILKYLTRDQDLTNRS